MKSKSWGRTTPVFSLWFPRRRDANSCHENIAHARRPARLRPPLRLANWEVVYGFGPTSATNGFGMTKNMMKQNQLPVHQWVHKPPMHVTVANKGLPGCLNGSLLMTTLSGEHRGESASLARRNTQTVTGFVEHPRSKLSYQRWIFHRSNREFCLIQLSCMHEDPWNTIYLQYVYYNYTPSSWD